MKEILLSLFSGAIETFGETKLEEVLQKLYNKNPALYKVAILGGLQFVKAIEPLTAGTATKYDDITISAIKDAITDSAKANGIELV